MTARSYFLFATTTAMAAVLAGPAFAQDQPPSPLEKPGWVLDVADEFNGTTLDESLWIPYYLEARTSADRAAADYELTGNTLKLRIQPSKLTYRSGETVWVSSLQTGQRNGLHKSEAHHSIPTIAKYVPRYGYFEIRAKAPASAFSGNHTAFWTVGWQDQPHQMLEFDISEDPGTNVPTPTPQILSETLQNVYKWGDSAAVERSKLERVTGANLTTEFHTYGLQWDPTGYQFFIDGVPKGSGSYSPAYPEVFLLSLYRGSDWTGCLRNETTTECFSSEAEALAAPFATKYYEIDYFRAYRRLSPTVMIDNDIHDVHGYLETGAWKDSTVLGVEGSRTRFIDAPVAATATWTPNLFEESDYHVEVFVPPHTNSTISATYQVNHVDSAGAPATSTVLLNQATASGWTRLGTYHLKAGKTGSVKLTATGSGVARADAVRFVRVTDLYLNGFETGGPQYGLASDFGTSVGGWSVVTNQNGTPADPSDDNRAYASPAISGGALAAAGSTTAQNYFVATRLTLKGAATGGGVIAYHNNSTGDYYMFRLNYTSQAAELIRVLNGTVTMLQSTPRTVQRDRSYAVALKAAGGALVGYVDGVAYPAMPDSSLTQGRFGVRSYGGQVLYDVVGAGNAY